MLRHILFFFFICLSLSACNSDKENVFVPEAPDYAERKLWYVQEKDKEVDVFYITPTCIFDWVDKESGLKSHHYDVWQEVMKGNFDYSLKLADGIFAEECNFYAPYYRQISLETWVEGEEAVDGRIGIALEDVKEAFRYYLDHFNRGKDFVLAGYSQGAKAVVELVKQLDRNTLRRMKAAYVIGYRITAADLKHPNVRPASGEEEEGVVICYNSVKSVADVWSVVGGGNRCCINPVNWRTDTVPAILDDSLEVRVNTQYNVLLIDGYDSSKVHIPLLDKTITEGNYHLSELTLFEACLRENVKKRIR